MRCWHSKWNQFPHASQAIPKLDQVTGRSHIPQGAEETVWSSGWGDLSAGVSLQDMTGLEWRLRYNAGEKPVVGNSTRLAKKINLAMAPRCGVGMGGK